MIPPALSSTSLYYYAHAVWQLEPVHATPAEPSADGAQPPDACDAAAAAAACEVASPEPASTAAAAAMRWVFKGYEWRLAGDWNCQATPEWEQWNDSKRDDAADSARSRERARRVAPPLPAPASDAGGAVAPEADEGHSQRGGAAIARDRAACYAAESPTGVDHDPPHRQQRQPVELAAPGCSAGPAREQRRRCRRLL